MLYKGLELHFAFDVSSQFADWQTNLFHGVAVTNGYAVVSFDAFFRIANGLEVYGYAEWSTDFVLTAVTFTDGTSVSPPSA